MPSHKVRLGFVDGDFGPGAHICQIFSADDDRDRVLRQYTVAGRRDGECCACFSDHVVREVLVRELAAEGVVASADEQDLWVSDTRTAYFASGTFEPAHMLGLLSAFHHRSRDQGYPGARVIGEMTAAIEAVPGGNRLLEYEAKVSVQLRSQPVTTVCQYDARQFDGASIFDILRAHPLIVIGGTVVQNPFFTSPEELLGETRTTDAGDAAGTDARALSQLLMMQSVLSALPTEAAVLAFACRGLRYLPGVAGAQHEAVPGDGPGFRVPIRSGSGGRGQFALQLKNPARFAALIPYVRNFAAMVALILDERARVLAAAQSHAELDRMVQERTAQLREEIAERKAVEVQLQLTLDSIPHAIFWKGRSGRYLGCNRAFARTVGLEPGEVVGKSDYDLPWDKAHVESYLAQDRAVIETGAQRGPYLSDIRLPDGTVRHVRVIKTPLTDPKGEVYAVLGVYEDVTAQLQADHEREQLQRQLAHAQKMESIGRLAGGVAHDFNNMLQAILSNASVALMEGSLTPAVQGHLQEIAKAAQRSGTLTQQLLAFARKQTIVPRRIDLNEAVSGMLRMLRRLIGEDIQLEWRPFPALPPVLLDPAQVDQVLANLVVNARDAIRHNGRIVIATDVVFLRAEDIRHPFDCEQGEYVVLRVSDNGTGISAEAREHLFEPFFTTKPEGRGTGLGLATVYGIANQNRGAVLVQTEIGRGTEFSVCFPGAAPGIAPTPVREPARVLEPQNVTVLLVEDEEAILIPTQHALRRHGYSVLAASMPEEAIRLAENYPGPIQLMITDVIMPQMHGPDLYRRIAQLKPGLRCVFISGYTADVLEKTDIAGENGVVFLEKPFTPGELIGRAFQALHPDSEHT